MRAGASSGLYRAQRVFVSSSAASPVCHTPGGSAGQQRGEHGAGRDSVRSRNGDRLVERSESSVPRDRTRSARGNGPAPLEAMDSLRSRQRIAPLEATDSLRSMPGLAPLDTDQPGDPTGSPDCNGEREHTGTASADVVGVVWMSCDGDCGHRCVGCTSVDVLRWRAQMRSKGGRE